MRPRIWVLPLAIIALNGIVAFSCSKANFAAVTVKLDGPNFGAKASRTSLLALRAAGAHSLSMGRT
jgi:hypothetical protein